MRPRLQAVDLCSDILRWVSGDHFTELPDGASAYGCSITTSAIAAERMLYPQRFDLGFQGGEEPLQRLIGHH